MNTESTQWTPAIGMTASVFALRGGIASRATGYIVDVSKRSVRVEFESPFCDGEWLSLWCDRINATTFYGVDSDFHRMTYLVTGNAQ